MKPCARLNHPNPEDVADCCGPVKATLHLALLLLLPAFGGGASAATALTDPRDAPSGPADLRRVAWIVGATDAEVILETYERPDTSSWDYAAALLLGNASEDKPRESYYLSKTLAGGAVMVARHDPNASAPPRLTQDGERLRFAFPRAVPAGGADTSCSFTVAGTGHFSGRVEVVDSVPDGGDVGDSDPWRLRSELCAPRPAPTPGTAAPLLVALLGVVALGLARRRTRRKGM